ncbi:MAG: hypothetical protein L6R00_21115 [Phycisphaerae bacterium]|nr:hypothetical protein [Phycisphaerae bacterium]
MTAVGGSAPHVKSGLYKRVISRAYETGGGDTLAGRYYKPMLGTAQDPDAEYDGSYGYESTGRLAPATGPGTPAYGVVYSFATDSDLESQIACKSDASTTVASTIRSFENTRDLITSIENKRGATSVSNFEYTNEALGRRTSVTVSGSALNTTETTGFELFCYTLDTPRGLRLEERRRRASRPGRADRNRATDGSGGHEAETPSQHVGLVAATLIPNPFSPNVWPNWDRPDRSE